ncbi:MAG: MFS transporter [Chloroflexi bacterium]|nr:MFS transporter [Chloroflexota bacterium]
MTIEAAPLAGGARVSLRRTFQALRHRDFRLYWAALIVSLLGLSFQTVAQQWLVYRLTGSALQLGIVGFIPALLSAPGSILGGLLADRVSRRRLVLITQSAMVGPPVGLALVIWSGQVQVWHIIAAASLLGFVAAIDLSVRTAMMPQLVAPQDLLNAQSLSSLVYQMARIVGPALAGLAIARVGEAVCFLINGLSYLAMVGAMAAMQLRPEAAVRERARRKGLVGSLLEGIRYTLRDRLVLGLFVVLAVQGLFRYRRWLAAGRAGGCQPRAGAARQDVDSRRTDPAVCAGGLRVVALAAALRSHAHAVGGGHCADHHGYRHHAADRGARQGARAGEQPGPAGVFWHHVCRRRAGRLPGPALERARGSDTFGGFRAGEYVWCSALFAPGGAGGVRGRRRAAEQAPASAMIQAPGQKPP